MSIRRIPDRYLKDTLYIYRESATIDAVGDFDTVKSLAYGQMKANVQPQTSEAEYDIQGTIHKQTHSAYFNRFVDGVKREIILGDIVLREDTGKSFLVIGIQELEGANPMITDSHHFKLILKRTTGYFEGITQFKMVTSRAKIV